jgi:cytochrome c oxidase assembly protein subunit 11
MSDKPVTGVSTYNVTPFESGLFFNKVQCFCFDEQRLEAHETVDLPVLFFVDPTIREEPSLINTNIITLSYTFFKVDEDDNN